MIKTHPVKNPTPQKLVKTVSTAIKEKSHKIQDYPKPIRIATVKSLREMDYSIRQIARVLGVGTETVQNYLDQTIDNRWTRYKDAVSRILTERRDTLRALTDNAIESKLQDVSNVPLRDLSGLYRVLNESENSTTQHSTLNQVINVHPALSRVIKAEDQEPIT